MQAGQGGPASRFGGGATRYREQYERNAPASFLGLDPAYSVTQYVATSMSTEAVADECQKEREVAHRDCPRALRFASGGLVSSIGCDQETAPQNGRVKCRSDG